MIDNRIWNDASVHYLISVDESLANGQLDAWRTLEVHANEGAWHGRIAGQEEWAAFLQQADESVAHGVDSQIRPVVAYANHNRRWLVSCSAREN